MLLYILLTSALFISSMLIHSQDRRRLLGAAEALPFSSLSLDLTLSIALFLRLKGFCERPEMKGCPQWERDCRDSAGGPRCYPELLTQSRSALQRCTWLLSYLCMSTNIYIPAVYIPGDDMNMNAISYGDDVMRNDGGISVSTFTQMHSQACAFR